MARNSGELTIVCRVLTAPPARGTDCTFPSPEATQYALVASAVMSPVLSWPVASAVGVPPVTATLMMSPVPSRFVRHVGQVVQIAWPPLTAIPPTFICPEASIVAAPDGHAAAAAASVPPPIPPSLPPVPGPAPPLPLEHAKHAPASKQTFVRVRMPQCSGLPRPASIVGAPSAGRHFGAETIWPPDPAVPLSAQ